MLKHTLVWNVAVFLTLITTAAYPEEDFVSQWETRAMPQTMAMAHTVVIGTWHVSAEETPASNGTSLKVVVDVEKYLKGSGKNRLPFSIQVSTDAETESYLKLSGQKQIAFLTEGVNPMCLPFSPALAQKARHEADDQKKYLASFNKIWKPDKTPHYKDVKRLINQMLKNPEDAGKAYAALEALGVDALPAMVVLMDDSRPVAAKSIALTTRNSFESVTHRPVETVFDVVSLVAAHFNAGPIGFPKNVQLRYWRVFLRDFEAKRPELEKQEATRGTLVLGGG